MRPQSDDTVTSATTTPARRAPCPTCGGSGFHPSTDDPTPCVPCQGAGIVPSASAAHDTAHMHAAMIAALLEHSAELDNPAPSTTGALRYAAEHLTVQAAMMVDATPHYPGADAAPADELLSQSMSHAGAEFAALHAVLIGIDGATAPAAMAGAAIVARSIAARMERAEDELAKLRAQVPRSGEDEPE